MVKTLPQKPLQELGWMRALIFSTEEVQLGHKQLYWVSPEKECLVSFVCACTGRERLISTETWSLLGIFKCSMALLTLSQEVLWELMGSCFCRAIQGGRS